MHRLLAIGGIHGNKVERKRRKFGGKEMYGHEAPPLDDFPTKRNDFPYLFAKRCVIVDIV